jgi:hypothetical protein
VWGGEENLLRVIIQKNEKMFEVEKKKKKRKMKKKSEMITKNNAY